MFGVRWAHPGRGGGQLGRRYPGPGVRTCRRVRRRRVLGCEAADAAREDSGGVCTRKCLAAADPAIGASHSSVAAATDARCTNASGASRAGPCA